MLQVIRTRDGPKIHVLAYVYTPFVGSEYYVPRVDTYSAGTTAIGTRAGPKNQASSPCLDTLFGPDYYVPP